MQDLGRSGPDDQARRAGRRVWTVNPSFDALAAARNAFALDTHLAWRMVTGFRKAWPLETRKPGI